ncbi:unnamed protein product [Brassicogethes aeneus]|uniref:SET domain-containing protein n=1 Tax=Brassicogethes aeneus TaxID=1431903 RepID=A0A9P0AWZ7_BRAAE|nr:unnamed protein product [Brassicogethes aeneus]
MSVVFEQVRDKYFSDDEWEKLPDAEKNRHKLMYENYTNCDEEYKIRKNPIRRAKLKPVIYEEVPEPNDDRYVFCDKCGTDNVDFCKKCGVLRLITDKKVVMGVEDRAKKTLPSCLEIHDSPIHNLGVFAKEDLENNLQMGPYEGLVTDKDNAEGYSWKLNNGTLVNAMDEKNSNWLRYVNCARHVNEQNIIAFQYRGKLYYRTFKNIKKGEELLVYYGNDFASELGIEEKTYFDTNLNIVGSNTKKADKEIENKIEYLVPREEKAILDFYKCEYCFWCFTTEDFKLIHMKRCKSRNDKVGETFDCVYECKHCSIQFFNKELCSNHEIKRAKLKPVIYEEVPEPNDDRYVFCDKCGTDNVDFCKKCGVLRLITDKKVPMGVEDRAKKTLPSCMEIRDSPIHNLGVFAKEDLENNLQMGPYEGLVNGMDEKNSNWLRYVNCARHVNEQNIIAFQYRGKLYYRTFKNIKKGEELLVYYGTEFAKELGIKEKNYFDANQNIVESTIKKAVKEIENKIDYLVPRKEKAILDYYKCEYCFWCFTTEDFKLIHMRRCKSRNDKVGENFDCVYECKHCSIQFFNKELCSNHERKCLNPIVRVEKEKLFELTLMFI